MKTHSPHCTFWRSVQQQRAGSERRHHHLSIINLARYHQAWLIALTSPSPFDELRTGPESSPLTGEEIATLPHSPCSGPSAHRNDKGGKGEDSTIPGTPYQF